MTLKIASGLAGCGLLLAGIFFSLAGKENEQPPKEASLIQSIQGPALYEAYCAVVTAETAKAAVLRRSRSRLRRPI